MPGPSRSSVTGQPLKFPPLAPPGCASGPLILDGWDRATLGGDALPGKCRITKAMLRLKLDKKSKAGTDGSRPTIHGVETGEIELEVTVWTDEQLDWLMALLASYLPRPNVKPQDRNPVPLDHPSIRHYGPVNVLVLGASPIVPAPDHGVSGRKLTIQMHHWSPPTGAGKQATKTATSADRKTRGPNKRTEDAKKRNPLPTAQAAAAKPT